MLNETFERILLVCILFPWGGHFWSFPHLLSGSPRASLNLGVKYCFVVSDLSYIYLNLTSQPKKHV